MREGDGSELVLAVLGVGAVAGAGLLAWWFLRSREDADVSAQSTWLQNRERAAGITEQRIVTFLDELEARGLQYNGVRYRVTVGLEGGVRTDAKQAQLYAKGRTQLSDGTWIVTDPAAVVTNAKTASQSKHGRGKAVDLWVVVEDGSPNGRAVLYPRDAPGSTSGERDAFFSGVYLALGQYGETFGLTWGGRWTSLVDRPHFEVA